MNIEGLKNKKGHRYSFLQLFKDLNYSVEIPIIQRDYAQGRKSKGEVRELFLKALYDYLDQNLPGRDLDFVYGSTEIDNKIEKFIPLDGQQRLTTLFLLHWYLAKISGNEEGLKEVLFDGRKSKFTYLTRTSSSEFCDALFKNSVDIKNLLINKITQKNSLSETIKDSNWYYLSWNKDPTIQSMLIMMDSIHDRFADRPEFFERIANNSAPIITFLYLDLGEFGLTEDLYIKMNSRGKPLTTFENFKARLEQHISNLFSETSRPHILSFENKNRNVSVKEYFSFNIDTKWANLFWQYRELAGDKNTFDTELMNFIYVMAANKFAEQNNFNREVFQYLAKNESPDLEITEYISFNKLYNLNILTKEFVEYLIDSLDCLANGNNKILNYLSDSFYFDENEMFKKTLTNRLFWPARVQFYAYTKYLIINPENKDGIYQWMRFIHNITENTRIEGAEDVVKAIKSLEAVLPHSNNILSFLAHENDKIDFFYTRQIQEEKIKACLILKNEKWKKSVEDFEKNSFLKGQLGFIFEFSGILDFYEKHLNCEWTAKEDVVFYNSFLFYALRSSILFGLIETPKNANYLVERAVLSKGNYLIPGGYNKYNFLSTTGNQRDFSWKRLLRLTQSGDSDSNNWKERRSYVKQLLDDEGLDIGKIEYSLKEICKILPTDWRSYFIQNPELIRYCEQGFIEFITANKINLVLKFQDNSRKREMYSYDLYLREFNEAFDITPFEFFDYREINRDNPEAFIVLEDWCFKRKYYAINLYYEENENTNEGYFLLIFYKQKGESMQNDYAQEIIDLLEEKKFKWHDEGLDFRIVRKTESAILKFLKELLMDLKAFRA